MEARTPKPPSRRLLAKVPELGRLPPTIPFIDRWLSRRSERVHAFWVCGVVWIFVWPVLFYPLAFMMGWGLLADYPLLYNGIPIVALVLWSMGLIAPIFVSITVPRSERRKLRVELRRRGIPICIACGYEGGDITALNCPECGAVQPTLETHP